MHNPLMESEEQEAKAPVSLDELLLMQGKGGGPCTMLHNQQQILDFQGFLSLRAQS